MRLNGEAGWAQESCFLLSKAGVDPCPLTAWLPVGCGARAFPALLIQPCVPSSLFCCWVRMHLLLLPFMFDKVGRRQAILVGNGERRDAWLRVVLSSPICKKSTAVLGLLWSHQKAITLELCCECRTSTNTSFGDRSGLTSLLGPSLAMWPWTSLLTSLSLC